jgi:hypothetical protein
MAQEAMVIREFEKGARKDKRPLMGKVCKEKE